MVWQPLEEHLKDVPTVLLSVDGVLNGLPFAALPGSRPGTFLIEEKSLVAIPVPQLLPEILAADRPPRKPGAAKPKTGERGPPSLLLVGDVDYGAEPGAASVALGVSRTAMLAPPGTNERVKWSPLAATRMEVDAIQGSFKQRFPDGTVTALSGRAATESAFREQAPRHRYLHLATHGFFATPRLRPALMPSQTVMDQERFGREGFIGHHPGLLSGLVLAGTNRVPAPESDDGILTALEVAALNLHGVDLVVLSACETGVGLTGGGEGALGVQRAFHSAGARSVVASLWKVDDQATAALMALFYHKLWREDRSPLIALREAQLTIYRHPERIPSWHGFADPTSTRS